MAKLSPDIRATLSQQKEHLLDLIDEAKSLEFLLLDSSQNQAFANINASLADCRGTTHYL
jgi:molybdopterin-guanine dinucleotide biosynthesis protein A